MSMRGSGTTSRFPPVLSRQIAFISSHRYDAWSMFKRCGRQRRDVRIAPSEKENDERDYWGGLKMRSRVVERTRRQLVLRVEWTMPRLESK